MHKAFLYRLYPSKPQTHLLDATLETCRRFYNQCLAERKQVWEEQQRTVGKFEQLRTVKTLKAENPSAKSVHSHVLQTVVQDLDTTFQAFFRRVKSGAAKPGFPRFVRRSKLSGGGITST
jgi:putative transposase